ncbi:MAG: AmmeMemoRadiSam system protein A [Bacillota bacterium]
MESLVFACLAPHPPIIVPEVGGRERLKASATVAAMEKLAQDLLATQPQVVIFITPHGTIFQDAIAMIKVPRMKGDLGSFGAPDVKFDYACDLELIDLIAQNSQKSGIPCVSIDSSMARGYRVRTSLDHGMMVPLYFFQQAGLKAALVSIGMSLLPFEDLYQFGTILTEAINQRGLRAAVVASGDMSHRLTQDAPAGFHPLGEEFDARVREAVINNNVLSLIDMPSSLAESAGECGLRPLIMLMGALDGRTVDSRVYSYEGPFGVGYMVAEFKPGDEDASRRMAEQLYRIRDQKVNEIRREETLPVRLARESLEHYVNSGQELKDSGDQLPGLPIRAGVFVSIKKHGQLRGCIGTTAPTRSNVAEEIIHNAISAGTGDPRFDPVEAEELDQLIYSVDVLGPPEPATGAEDLDPHRFGVIVRNGGRTGLLLPDLEGVDTVEEQVAIAKRKAGIGHQEQCQMERFEVVRYK